MESASLLHKPQSEYAYLYENELYLQMRTKRQDVREVKVCYGDPYALSESLKKVKMTRSFHTKFHDYWTISLSSPKTKRISYGFQVRGMDGTVLFYGDRGIYPLTETDLTNENYYFRMPYYHRSQEIKVHNWVQGTVWYQIFIDRFSNGDKTNDPENAKEWDYAEAPKRDDFFGGDLQGILNKLDYLDDLGVNGLYLTPLFEAHSNHKYDTINYKRVDPDFGDERVLKKLVDEAHKRGMRVMLDAVFNHIGYWSKQWQDVLLHQESSSYKDWFYIHEFPVPSLENTTAEEWEDWKPSQYESFANTGHMPKLNFTNSEVTDYFLALAKDWTKKLDIDAWRLDVSNEVDPEFWKLFRKEVKAVDPDIYILGEIWHSSRFWLEGDQFDGVMNYSYCEPIEQFFFKESVLPSEFQEKIGSELALYPHPVQTMNFNLLDSHDTRRVLTKAGRDKKRVQAAFTFLFLQPGTPCVYYGTEVGMEGGPDPDNRRCMIWEENEQDQEILTFMKELIAFRHRYSDVLSRGNIEWFEVSDINNTVGIRRMLNGKTISGFFNLGEMNQPLTFGEEETIKLTSSRDDNIEPGGFVVTKGTDDNDEEEQLAERIEKVRENKQRHHYKNTQT